jgi:amino-acid N-acetyltransferase
MRARKARLPDAERIHALIADFAREERLLPRSLAEICENIRDFSVIEQRGAVIACGALHFYGPELAEVRSVAVDRAQQRCGAGTRLVEALLAEARAHSIGCVCLFTHIPAYFARLGFVEVEHQSLPEKALRDCIRCPRVSCCNEAAMVLGALPLRPAAQSPGLVALRPLAG